MDTINYSVRRMQAEEPAEQIIEEPALPSQSIPALPSQSMPATVTLPVPQEKPAVEEPQQQVPKRKYYGFSKPTGFPGTEGAEDAGLSTMQKVGLTSLGMIILSGFFRAS